MSWRNVLIKKQIMFAGPFHFVDSSEDTPPDKSMHFSTYIGPELLSATPGLLDDLGREFAKRVDSSIDCIVATGIESVPLGTAIATQIDLPICFLSTQFRFRQIFLPTIHNAKVALVVTSISGSNTTTQAIKAVNSAKGKVLEVLTVWDHMNGTLKVKPKVKSLVAEDNPKWTLEGCLDHGPCARGIPIKRRPASGAELEKMYLSGQLQLPEDATLKFVN